MKRTMKSAVVSLLAVSILAVIAWVSVQAWKDYYRHSEPAPGWSIATDGEGNYKAVSSVGTFHRRRYQGNSRQAAINTTWYYYEAFKHIDEEEKKFKPETYK